MNFDRQLKRTLISLTLTWVLMFPALMQVAHALEDHKHAVCEEVSTHVHETTVDCSLCDYNFSSFHFTFNSPVLLLDSPEYTYLSIPYASIEKNGKTHSFYLRGPPRIT